MANFNPDIKDVNPVNPIGWSKAAEVPSQFASALAQGIEGIGKTIGLGVHAADTLVKENIQNASEALFRPAVDDEAARLSAVDFSQKLGVSERTAASSTTSPGASNATTSEPVDNIPPGLQRLPQTLSVLEGARANGHLSETAYYGRLMAMAKDLRSNYPVGYRQYIDQEISKITGVDPANAYMKSIIGDINASVGNQQAEKNKILARLLEHNGLHPDIPKIYEALQQNRITPRFAMEFLQPLEADKVNHDRRMQKSAELEAGSKEAERAAEVSFRTFGSDRVASTLSGALKIRGFTPEQIKDTQAAWFRGERDISTPEMEALKNQQIAYMNADRDAMIKELNFVDTNPNSKTYRPIPLAATLKDKGAKMMEDALLPHQKIISDFNDKNVGMVFANERAVKAFKDDDAKVYFEQPEFRVFASRLDFFKDHGGGELVAQVFGRLGELPDIKQVSLVGKLMDLATTPDPRGNKETSTLREFIDKTAKEEKVTGIPNPKNYEEVQRLMTGRDGLSVLSPTTPDNMKVALINNFFGPGNLGVLKRIKPDYTDERGRPIPGQESWFKGFTSPEFVQEVNRLGGTAKDNYTAWVKQTYEELTLQNIDKLKTMNITGAYKVEWNSATSQFTFKDLTRNPSSDPNQAYGYRTPSSTNNPVNDTIISLNKSIAGLRNVYRGASNLSDEDIQAKVLETLHFNEQRYGMIEGLPAKLLTSIQAEQKQIEAEKAAAEAKKKATEAQYK